MREIGSYEAKTHLPALLRAVEKGETITITRNGDPIADIVPHGLRLNMQTSVKPGSPEAHAAAERIWKARQGRPKTTLAEILSARDDGRE